MLDIHSKNKVFLNKSYRNINWNIFLTKRFVQLAGIEIFTLMGPSVCPSWYGIDCFFLSNLLLLANSVFVSCKINARQKLTCYVSDWMLIWFQDEKLYLWLYVIITSTDIWLCVAFHNVKYTTIYNWDKSQITSLNAL